MTQEKLERLMNEAFPPAAVTPELDNAIYQMASESDRQRARKSILKRRVRVGFVTAFAFSLLCLAVIFEPRLAFAYALHKMRSAMGQQRFIHMRVWNVDENGTRMIARTEHLRAGVA